MIKTYTHGAFLPLRRLAQLKHSKRRRISLVIPARNEAATIGEIVSRVRTTLVEEVGLLDEIVVMDGHSGDATPQVAARAGATVVDATTEVSAGMSLPPGKGAALWKALFVTSGDIVACIDADIRSFSERFVYGLIGPLLSDETIAFVKGAYRRPLVVDGVADESYGGRVTEILVRPMLSAFYPALARLRQPLAGEYAFRRHVAEELPFFSGYGVEIGLVIDIFRRYGLDAFAQVDMGVRYHRNRSGVELGRMAFGVMHTILRRLREEGRIGFSEEPATVMISPGLSGWDEMDLADIEIPSAANTRTTRGV
jgi:glucosyl-3-phosphoglycerate synthase